AIAAGPPTHRPVAPGWPGEHAAGGPVGPPPRIVMSTTPSALTSTNGSPLRRCRRRGCLPATRHPRTAGERAAEPEDHERADAVERTDERDLLAESREEDLNDYREREGQNPPDARPPDAGAEREQK